MRTSSTDTIGTFIARHRAKAGITQSRLGELAGYEKGAGVSVSRIETGKQVPTVDRANKIADALHLSNDDRAILHRLRSSASTAAQAAQAPITKESLAARKAKVDLRIKRRVQRTEELAKAHQEAVELASAGFFNELVQLASQVDGAPVDKLPTFQPPQLRDLVNDHPQFGVMSANIARTFMGDAGRIFLNTTVGAAAGAAAGGLLAYSRYINVAKNGIASTGAPISGLTGIAQSNAILAAIGGGTILQGGNGIPGGHRAIMGTVATGLLAGAALGLITGTLKTMKERQEALFQIKVLERELEHTQARFDYWCETIRRCTQLLEYISVHGTHALQKWKTGVRDFPVNWADFTPPQKMRFVEMLTIAACETTVDLTPVDQIMSCSDDDFDDVVKELDDTISAAETMIHVIV